LQANRGRKPRSAHLRSKRNKHGSVFDIAWRKAVFERDKWTCRRCGVKGGRLQAHHIKPYKGYPHLRYLLGNGKTLCIECHKKTATYGWKSYHRRRAKIAEERIALVEAQPTLFEKKPEQMELP
jgi:5-methylcytosine-specific restriction endonuclease McrA